MQYGICVVPVMPLRAQPSHKSEMISQLIFGECFCIQEKENDWIKIQCAHDGYEGWCSINQGVIIEKYLYESSSQYIAANWVNEILVNGHPMQIPLGSVLKDMKQGKTIWGGVSIGYKGKILNVNENAVNEKLIRRLAFLYLNTPYLWGGRSPFGIDCSGLTQSVYKLLNKSLPRDAWQQAGNGGPVGFLQMAKCGDLAFFDNAEGHISHVGILLNEYEIIHAAGKVRVDKIDAGGIINGDTKQRTHRLRIIKRFF